MAAHIIALVQAGAPGGAYHATSSGETTWYGLARQVFRLLGADENRVRPVTSGQYPAPRPADSVLGHDAWAAAGLKVTDAWRAVLLPAFPVLLPVSREASS